MNVGVSVPMAVSDGPDRVPTWADVRDFAQRAEAVGLDSVWVCDHFLSDDPDRPEDPAEGILEAWTIVSALAASTSRVELGQLVMCASFRNPGLLAKMAVTADDVSGGRLVLGLGAGWYDPEYRAFGYPTNHRADRFEEALTIITLLLRGQNVTVDGRYHQVRDAVLLPPPDRHIPVLVAAGGPRMLQLTARHADAWNTAWYGLPDDRLHQDLAALDSALAAEGRDRETLRRTVGLQVGEPTAGTQGGRVVPIRCEVDELAEAFDAYEQLGIDDMVLQLETKTEGSLERIAEAMVRAR